MRVFREVKLRSEIKRSLQLHNATSVPFHQPSLSHYRLSEPFIIQSHAMSSMHPLPILLSRRSANQLPVRSKVVVIAQVKAPLLESCTVI